MLVDENMESMSERWCWSWYVGMRTQNPAGSCPIFRLSAFPDHLDAHPSNLSQMLRSDDQCKIYQLNNHSWGWFKSIQCYQPLSPLIERHSTTSSFSSCLFGLSSANVTILMWRKTGWLFGECKDEKILIGLCLSSRTTGQGVRWKVQTVNHTMPQAFPAIHYRCTILSCPGIHLQPRTS